VLILTRKRDESIMVGEEIRITVLDVKGENVRLGIDAPRNVKVLREELYRAVREENTKAGTVSELKDDALGDLDALLPDNRQEKRS